MIGQSLVGIVVLMRDPDPNPLSLHQSSNGDRVCVYRQPNFNTDLRWRHHDWHEHKQRVQHRGYKLLIAGRTKPACLTASSLCLVPASVRLSAASVSAAATSSASCCRGGSMSGAQERASSNSRRIAPSLDLEEGTKTGPLSADSVVKVRKQISREIFFRVRILMRINDSIPRRRLNHCCAKSVSGRPSSTFSTIGA